MNGHCHPRFAPLRDLLERNLAEGEERGASICVVQDGETVVDLWGGEARNDVPWERDTLVNTFSVTKTMLALVVLRLADAGTIDLDAPVARYWPEFAVQGKSEVLVRHVLGHTSGLPGWDQEMTLADLCDTRRAAALLAAQAPWFEPGQGSGYQAISHGHLLGELVQRTDGRTAGAVLREDFAEPLGADYWLGAPESVDERVAVLKSPPHAPDLDEFGKRALLNPMFSMKVTTTRDFLGAELGGLNGQGNARSVARVQSVVSHGGVVDGKRYLSPEVIERIFEVQSDSPDRVLGHRIPFGTGYALPAPELMPTPSGRICWWVGNGGAVVVNDLDRRMTIAYAMNKMAAGLVGAAKTRDYVRTTYDCVEV
ncbi:class A beta-lactamase-related serine hydrolase [Saccharopolyspora rhizosphaerae]|uniref:Class A beta-lactamase-related serine hydrolase n=1 Tax=Saccharopolyspora rhizosphaerae TaxID=2492662 RepID=A0A3R8NZL4_9PSEU|nr:serine hydrolase domain-containing protein [Saccharopolyspora rhizosphaerae]RRO16703.1 class A beta-lactamase-related serine hydrolase [Saccharopolyspora rhizosphaerae]